MSDGSDGRPTESKVDLSAMPECGIVMPISEIDGCSAAHWTEVLGILTDALLSSGFKPSLVSNSGNSPVIQKRIVQNLYACPLVVCDVSARNPNVMMELGMRLAFDKPTIVIKDDKTGYSFDISPLEHFTYPRDLRYTAMVDFKAQLGSKAKIVYTDALNGRATGSYLRSFGDFETAKINTTEVTSDKFIIDQLDTMRKLIEANLGIDRMPQQKASKDWFEFRFKFSNATKEDMIFVSKRLEKVFGVLQNEIVPYDKNLLVARIITEIHVFSSARQLEALVDHIVKERQQEVRAI